MGARDIMWSVLGPLPTAVCGATTVTNGQIGASAATVTAYNECVGPGIAGGGIRLTSATAP